MNRSVNNQNDEQGRSVIYDGEEVFNCYYDFAGNYHWTGVITGEHIVNLTQVKGADDE